MSNSWLRQKLHAAMPADVSRAQLMIINLPKPPIYLITRLSYVSRQIKNITPNIINVFKNLDFNALFLKQPSESGLFYPYRPAMFPVPSCHLCYLPKAFCTENKRARQDQAEHGMFRSSTLLRSILSLHSESNL